MLGSLASSYAAQVDAPPILQATIDKTGYKGTWEDLQKEVTATVIGTQLIDIQVIDDDAEMAKKLADELANQVIAATPTLEQQKKAEDQRAFITGQLTQLQKQIETGQKSLNDLQSRANLENDPNKLKDYDQRITTLQTKIDGWQKSYTDYTNILNSTSSNYVTVALPAELPKYNIARLLMNVVIGLLIGLVLAACAIFVAEFMDDRVRDGEGVKRALNSMPLAAVTPVRGVRKPADFLAPLKNPNSAVAEAYRTLRVNLHFAGLENPSGALLVTSAARGEGKTMTAVNLAATYAQAGRRVVLVDGNLRHPSLHSIFNLPNQTGLTNVLAGDGTTLEQVKQQTSLANLCVITTGPIPPNATSLLDSKQMSEAIQKLRAESDMVLVDAAPVLGAADARILGERCSGAVVVLDTTKTSGTLSRSALATLTQSKIPVFGVVLNKAAKASLGY